MVEQKGYGVRKRTLRSRASEVCEPRIITRTQLVLLDLPTLRGLDETARKGRGANSATGARRDFMFQVDGYKAERQTITCTSITGTTAA